MLGKYNSLIPRSPASKFKIFDVPEVPWRDILHVTPGWQAPESEFTKMLDPRVLCPSSTHLNGSMPSNSATGPEHFLGSGFRDASFEQSNKLFSPVASRVLRTWYFLMKRSATRYVNIEILLTKKIYDDGRNTLKQARIEARKLEREFFC